MLLVELIKISSKAVKAEICSHAVLPDSSQSLRQLRIANHVQNSGGECFGVFWLYQQAVGSVLDNFLASAGSGSHHGQSGRHAFQDGVWECLSMRRQDG